jgi:DEAD/DEAH box helicase domain-containing protein
MKPKKDAIHVDRQLHPAISQALQKQNPNFRLFRHQAKSLDAIRAGRNLIVVTQTASGKTLCYNPAIFEHFLARDPSAHALYVFPLNALMMDQKEKIDELRDSLKQRNLNINAELLVRGLKVDKRREIARKNPHIVATNPELLSWILLAEAEDWREFFSRLKYVVIDEVHSYRGILGLHMAGILRRLLLQARRLGNEPQFVLSSATVSKPGDLASRLTSLPEQSFDLLDEGHDGSAQKEKHWVVINPEAHANGNGYDGYLTTAALTMIELLNAHDRQGKPSPLNTILFAKSIRDVNKVFKIVQENLRHYPHLQDKVRKYVSAELNSREKREIYNGLRLGQLRGVVSTNALGAGIDIGKLDACIIAGFPFTVMDMRQMAGRVGRREEGIVAYVPRASSAVDQFYRSNPVLLLEQPPEEFVVDPGNPYIARKHINASAFSLGGVNQQELKVFGERTMDTVNQAIAEGVMSRNGSQFRGTKRNFSDKADRYAISGIRSREQEPFALCKAPLGRCNSSANCLEQRDDQKCEFYVTTLDRPYAYRDAHPGAIYEAPDGLPYRSLALSHRPHVVYLAEIEETSLERTFVEQDTSIEILGKPRAVKQLPSGAELQVGEVRVTRSFTGYYTYELLPKRNCRRCRKEYEANITSCPRCGHKTALSYGQSKSKRQDFPPAYHNGLKIELKTVACWLKVPAELEGQLYPASPCKLPGDQNKVADFLKKPLQLENLPDGVIVSREEWDEIGVYHEYAGTSLRQRRRDAKETVLFPGVYGQCLLSSLRRHSCESRSLELFQAVTQYPVTDNLTHVCRNCRTSVLIPAMHTLEHTVLMRYPSVALGDISDLGSFTVRHPDTGMPTIFWYDNYDGGLGAAEKVFEKFQDLLARSEQTITSCSCHSLEGCPNCTHLGNCDRQNDSLSKVGLLALAALLQGKQPGIPYEPFVYRSAQKAKFESAYQENEYVEYEHGIGEEAPQSQQTVFDPFKVLRVQTHVHDPVLQKAYEVRGEEITNEVPPVSEAALSEAYQSILGKHRPLGWNIKIGQDPYQILEILPTASLPMSQKIYHVIARQVHPDTYPGDKTKATEMMKLVNDAFEKVRKEKRNGFSGNGFDL